MGKFILSGIIQFVFLIVIQALVLNNIQFSGYVNPYLYIVFILWLPLSTPKALLLFLAFVLGLTLDVFTNTIGMHTSATVFMAFCRPYVLQTLVPRDGYEINQTPGIKDLGLKWFAAYAAMLTLLHHLFLFFVEVFRFTDFYDTIIRVVYSWVFTMILIFIAQYFRYNAEERR